ncbi:hypothetical protein SAMN04489724_1604 [Algoriphagus locisalis]|uniref:Lipoprotein n=1 Tax=Algoriphagus locisalis TaxID=305507 RepID=A0A1I7A123_9BACT|nr:hypothetical protein SAMN04489724_1604 [Algoriphagus locisalis]
MKKLLFGMAFMGAMMCTCVGSFGQASVDPDPGEGGFQCKTESIRCNWYNAVVRLICHQNGDGISCNCGESTTCS